jgi:hypothetical protein
LKEWLEEIKDIVISYFVAIIYPFRVHDYLRYEIPLPEPVYDRPKKLSLYEAITMSWCFQVGKGLINIFLVNLTIFGLLSFQNEDFSYFRELSLGAGLSGHYFYIASIILQTILFPVITLFIVEYWIIVIKFVAGLLEVKGDKTRMAHDILTTAQSSHAFVLVPIFGELVQKLSSFIFMYAGIRKHLNASPALTVLVLLSPLFIFIVLGTSFAFIIFAFFSL